MDQNQPTSLHKVRRLVLFSCMLWKGEGPFARAETIETETRDTLEVLSPA